MCLEQSVCEENQFVSKYNFSQQYAFINKLIPIFFSLVMAKGKHAPSKGAVRPDKIIHPNSRKAAKMAQKANKRAARSASQFKIGGSKLQSLGEKLNWFKDNLQFCYNEGEPFTCSVMLTLANAYLSRFQGTYKKD